MAGAQQPAIEKKLEKKNEGLISALFFVPRKTHVVVAEATRQRENVSDFRFKNQKAISWLHDTPVINYFVLSCPLHTAT